MNIAVGLVIGVLVGLGQLALLLLFTSRVTGGGGKFVAAGLAQWVLPFAALLLVGIFYTRALLWAGIGIAAALIIGAIVYIMMRKGR
ncbi:MAG: hypothetical protein LBN99_04755 [Oscillospiraceae bacterium]|jgi:hypothetical protein|nr:hypothetical protein [Oscillospiraceae bacterium]